MREPSSLEYAHSKGLTDALLFPDSAFRATSVSAPIDAALPMQIVEVRAGTTFKRATVGALRSTEVTDESTQTATALRHV